MKKRIFLILACVLAVALGFGIYAVADTMNDVEVHFYEDGGGYTKTVSLAPEGAEGDVSYALEYRYGFLYADTDGGFVYELDTDNGDVKKAQSRGSTLSEEITALYTDADGKKHTATATFVIQTTDAAVKEGAYPLLNNGEAATVTGRFFDADAGITMTGIDAPWGRYLPDTDFTYTLHNSARHVQALSAGQTSKKILTFRVKVGDKLNTQRVIIIVHGSDDTPTVQSFTKELPLDGQLTASGNVLAGSKPGDGANTLRWGTETAAAGTVTRNTDGTYAYATDLTNAAVSALTDGGVITETFTYTYTDRDGSLASGTLTVRIVWADISPTVQSYTHTFTEDESEDADDPVYLYEIDSVLDGSTFGNGTTVFEWEGPSASAYGTVALGADGAFSYRLDNDSAAVQRLYPGHGASEIFTYTYTDQDGSIARGSVTVNITGMGDAPTVEDSVISLYDGNDGRGNVLAGSMLGDGTAAEHTFTWGDEVGVYCTVSKEANGSFTATANTAAARALSDGDIAEDDEFTFTYTDVSGACANGTLTVRVTGVNDEPDATGGASADVSLVRPTVTDNVLSGITLGDGTRSEHTVAWATGSCDYGTLTAAANGSYTYVLDPDNADVRGLVEGGTLTDTRAFTVTDKDGDTSTGTLTITVKWEDLTPALKPDATFSHTFTEDVGSGQATGSVMDGILLGNGTAANHTVTWDDSDLPDGVSINGLSNGSYTLIVHYNENSIRRLMDDDTLTGRATFTCNDVDGSECTGAVNVTVNGATNDEPEPIAIVLRCIEDGSTYAFSGNVFDSIKVGDGVNTVEWCSTSSANEYGAMTLSPDGGYTYTFYNSARDVQKLAQGEVLMDGFGYLVTDEDGRGGVEGFVTIRIEGANDDPGPDDATVTFTIGKSQVSDSAYTFRGDLFTLGAMPGDGDPSVTWTAIDLSANTWFSSFTGNADGSFTVVLRPAAVAVLTEAKGITLGVTVTEGSGGGTASIQLNVEITP